MRAGLGGLVRGTVLDTQLCPAVSLWGSGGEFRQLQCALGATYQKFWWCFAYCIVLVVPGQWLQPLEHAL